MQWNASEWVHCISGSWIRNNWFTRRETTNSRMRSGIWTRQSRYQPRNGRGLRIPTRPRWASPTQATAFPYWNHFSWICIPHHLVPGNNFSTFYHQLQIKELGQCLLGLGNSLGMAIHENRMLQVRWRNACANNNPAWNFYTGPR